MLLESSTRPGFCDKVTRNKNNRKSPKRYHDAKWSDLSKFRAASPRLAVCPGNGCVLDRTKTPTSRSIGTNKQRNVGAKPLGDSNKLRRTYQRQAKPFRYLFVYYYRNASSDVGGSNPPYAQREAHNADRAPRCTREGLCQGMGSCPCDTKHLRN